MSEEEHVLHSRSDRIRRTVEIRLRSVDHPEIEIGTETLTINLSRRGMLLELPRVLDAVAGQEVLVECIWPGGRFQTGAVIVRFESPYQGDPRRQVTALTLNDPLPAELLEPV